MKKIFGKIHKEKQIYINIEKTKKLRSKISIGIKHSFIDTSPLVGRGVVDQMRVKEE